MSGNGSYLQNLDKLKKLAELICQHDGQNSEDYQLVKGAIQDYGNLPPNTNMNDEVDKLNFFTVDQFIDDGNQLKNFRHLLEDVQNGAAAGVGGAGGAGAAGGVGGAGHTHEMSSEAHDELAKAFFLIQAELCMSRSGCDGTNLVPSKSFDDLPLQTNTYSIDRDKLKGELCKEHPHFVNIGMCFSKSEHAHNNGGSKRYKPNIHVTRPDTESTRMFLIDKNLIKQPGEIVFTHPESKMKKLNDWWLGSRNVSKEKQVSLIKELIDTGN